MDASHPGAASHGVRGLVRNASGCVTSQCTTAAGTSDRPQTFLQLFGHAAQGTTNCFRLRFAHTVSYRRGSGLSSSAWKAKFSASASL